VAADLQGATAREKFIPQMSAAAGALQISTDSGCYAEMSRTSTRLKQQAEKRFPHKVDVPVPPGGIGRPLNAMFRNW
jgi:hypothetical protein